MKVRAWMTCGYVGTDRVEILDIDIEGLSEDEADEEIEGAVRDWALDFVEWGYTPIEENPREKGDDDGSEYADPRDERDGRDD